MGDNLTWRDASVSWNARVTVGPGWHLSIFLIVSHKPEKSFQRVLDNPVLSGLWRLGKQPPM